MRVINGGLVNSFSMRDEYELLPDRDKHRNLIKHRTKKYQYLVDRMLMMNPELSRLMKFIGDRVSKNWVKTIRGRLISLMLVRYMAYNMNPQWSAYRHDLILFGNYSILQNYLHRIVKVLILNYNLPSKLYKLTISKKNLQLLSQLWANDMYDDSVKMLKHYYKLNPNAIPTYHAQQLLDCNNNSKINLSTL